MTSTVHDETGKSTFLIHQKTVILMALAEELRCWIDDGIHIKKTHHGIGPRRIGSRTLPEEASRNRQGGPRVLDTIARRGSRGVILKAPEAPEVNAAVMRLAEAGIPVVTLVTDLPFSQRVAYVGIDNRSAGATAAYLINQLLGERDRRTLVALSRTVFRG